MHPKLSNLLLIALFVFSIQSVLAAQTSQVPSQSIVAPIDAKTDAALQRATTPLRQSPTWYPYLITRPTDRQWIESLPISERPNRTFHIYGNAVRAGLLPHGPIGRLVFGK